MPIVTVSHLSFSFPQATAPTLRDICCEVEAGSLFLLLGPSGSGKTTLLRLLAAPVQPDGTKSGLICVHGTASFVPQRPEALLTCAKTPRSYLQAQLAHLPAEVAKRRLEETIGYFDLAPWLDLPTEQLSGGQRQLLCVTGALAAGAKLLVLDEPTAQLDPIAAGALVNLLRRLCRELCLTVILSEHRTEELFPMADQVGVLCDGILVTQGAPQAVAQHLLQAQQKNHACMTTPVRLHAALSLPGPCSITIGQCRAALERGQLTPVAPAPDSPHPPKPTVLELRRVWFRYEKDRPDVLRELSFSLHEGEIFAVVGGNGVGKSTMLGVLSGALRPYSGKVLLHGKPVHKDSDFLLVPQDPLPALGNAPLRQHWNGTEPLVREMGLDHLLDRSPERLSCGEIQRAAIALALRQAPQILLLDEPTRGIDPGFRDRLAKLLRRFAEQGVCMVIVSHDVEFCAEVAHRCALLFNGSLIAPGSPNEFFGGNAVYTTASNRIGRQWFPDAVTCTDLIRRCVAQLTP